MADGQNGPGEYEVVDLGSRRRPWPAYVALVVVLLAAAAFGMHRLAAAAVRGAPSAVPYPRTSTSSGTAGSRAPVSPDRRTVVRTFEALGPRLTSAGLARYASSAPPCMSGGTFAGLRLSSTYAGTHPEYLSASCGGAPGVRGIVLRRAGGRFGGPGAVVLYPALRGAGSPPPGGTPTTSTAVSLTWAAPGGRISVGGDLARAELSRIARAVRVDLRAGHKELRIRAVPGLRVVARGPAYGPGGSTAAYDAAVLGLSGVLGRGTLLTEVSIGVGGLMEVYIDPFLGHRAPITVHGHPGVVTRSDRDGISVSWSLAPGVVARVTWAPQNTSPGTPSLAQARSVVRLAEHSQLYALTCSRQTIPCLPAHR